MSAYPSSTSPGHPTAASAPADPFVTGAVEALSRSLFDARSRAAIAWLAGLGVLVFAPLAMASRNGWAFAALMMFAIACIARWVAGLMFERGERAQAQPTMVLILNAVVGAGWAAAAITTMLGGHGFGPSLVLVATTVVAAAAVPMFQGHRDATWWLLGPLAALPITLAFADQPWALPLAAACAAGLGAAAWHAHQAQAHTLARIETDLRARHLHTQWQREQQAGAAAAARLESRERELALLWGATDVGIVRVDGYVIQGMSDHLAQRLGRAADQWVRRDVLSLFAKEHHAALDAIVKRRAADAAATAPPHRVRVSLAGIDGTMRAVDLVVGAGRADAWLVLEAVDAPASTATIAADPAAARGSLLDRSGVQRRLEAHAGRRQRATVVAVALSGLDALAQAHGDAAADGVRDAVAQRLDAVCRGEDGVAMLDDACWAVLMTGEPSDLTLSLMCDRVHSAMATPHHVGITNGHGVVSVQLGVSVESMTFELDVAKASTAMAQIDEFVAHARDARRRLSPSPSPVSASGGVITHAPPVIVAPPQVPAVMREEAAVATRRAPVAASAAAAPISIERIHLDPLADDE